MASPDRAVDRDGLGTNEIMRRAGKSKTCLWRWQERFMHEGVDGLLRDKTRLSRVAPLPSAVAERVVALTQTDPPGETTHWTGAAMAKAAGISLSSVQRIWRAHGLQPDRVRQFKLSRDPEFVPKLRDIVGLYIDPPAHAMVLSVDEKSQIQALDCTQPGLPLKPGRCGTMTHDYKKERHHDAVRRPRCARRQAHRPLHATPPASGIHPFPQRDRGRNPGRQDHPRDPRQLRPAQASQNPSLAGTASALRLPLHATSASWLNAVEGFFAKLGKRRLKRGVFCSIVDLQAAIHHFLRETNDDPKPFVWSADPDKIIAAVRRGAPSVRFDPNDLADPTRSAVMFEYRLEHVMSFYINAQFPEMIGPIPEGMQLNFYITGGEISGPKVVGKVRPVGGDWMTVRRDGVGILDIKGTLETQDGALIYATIDGTFDFGEDGYDKILRGWHPPSGAPFRASPRFRTAHPNYLWLNRGHFLAIGAAFTERLRIEYEIYAVL